MNDIEKIYYEKELEHHLKELETISKNFYKLEIIFIGTTAIAAIGIVGMFTKTNHASAIVFGSLVSLFLEGNMIQSIVNDRNEHLAAVEKIKTKSLK